MSEDTNPPNGAEIFSTERIERCEEYVSQMQRKLDKAVANNEKRKIRWYLDLLLNKSEAIRIVAVNNVTTNSGSYTAGVDGVRMLKPSKVKSREAREEIKKENLELKMELLENIDINKKPSPIKRVMIPKSNGKMRPLGIPTLMDRIIQDILRMALEPITEYHANENSYGFRPKRSCQDAIEHIHKKLARKTSPKWIVEGDIKGCFDHISHEHVSGTLLNWGIQESVVVIVNRMLKSRIQEKIRYHDKNGQPQTELGYEIMTEGTPQGGILSPMLANVALTAFDNFCASEFGKRAYRPRLENGEKVYERYRTNPLVRYADDFIITAKTEKEAVRIKEKIAQFLKKEIDLELSEEKTHITNVHDGFYFLGFNIRKYRIESPKSKYHKIGKLLIKPQKEKVDKFLQKIQETLDEMKQATADMIIRKLNPILRGFAMYYRFVVSKRTFSYIKDKVWSKMWRWCKRRHPKKALRWIYRKYYDIKAKIKDIFFSQKTGSRLIQINKIPIVRFRKIKSYMRVHDGSKEAIEYWKNRKYVNALSQIYSIAVKKLFKKQKGLCPCCGKEITKEQIENKDVHRHHMLPKSEGGTDRLNNRRLIHLSCHKKLHSILSRKQMAYWFKKKLNYVSKNSIVDITEKPEAYEIPVVV